MKVLFAVNNDEISNAIVKKYQKDYKEILSYKNVYYFNAILKELQKDKTYDRVVISEDLEPFANNNYDTIDKFLFDKLDNISDEATNAEGNDTDIILICTDRRSKSDEMLNKLFGIGIYNAIIGQDRSIDEVCKLINKPRTKKEAKLYYKIEAENVNYQSENEDSVSETEVQNILAHYKRLGKNEDKYVDSFNNIVSQYTDAQLKIIIRYLPMGVKAVLEENSPKYQELVDYNGKSRNDKPKLNQYNNTAKRETGRTQEAIKVEMIRDDANKSNITKPILIPTGVNKSQVKRLIKQEKPKPVITSEVNEEESLDYIEPNMNTDIQEEKPKRGRGRPKKIVPEEEKQEEKPKRGRGRPRKNPIVEEKEQEDEDLVDLFNLEDEEPDISEKNNNVEEQDEDVNLFDLDEDDDIEENNGNEEIDLFNLDNDEQENEEDDDLNLFDLSNKEPETSNSYNSFGNRNEIEEVRYRSPELDFNTLITKDKKIVSFVGTTKNGTSFIVNNVAQLLASRGISTAVLDMTKTRNAYYIYTDSKEQLMNTAKECIYKLKSGICEGININRNLTIYTSVPDDNTDYSDVESILGTLIKKYSVVLIDCDFSTPIEYFAASQETYLVQSMDVLTIQPLTAFLRDLQSKGVLKQEKLRIVINKGVNIKSVPVRMLIGGISKYNDPSMTYMKELFNRDKIQYCIIPFEIPNYIKYLDSLITCSITLNGYTKPFITALNELGNMIYPLLNKQTYSPRGNKYKDNFSSEMNDTLSKMKRKYQ